LGVATRLVSRGTKRPARSTGSNRRRRGALRDRLPSPAAVGRGLARAGRAALPGIIAVAAAAAVSAGAVVGYRWLTTSPRFAPSHIEITGAETLDRDHIVARLDLPDHANLFRLDVGALERRLAADPWIISAHVSRRLPDRLLVSVDERHPAAVVQLGELYLADAHGEVFARVRPERDDLAGLPIITGIDRAEYQADPAATAGRVRAALILATTWDKRGDRPALGEIHLDDRRGVTLYTLAPTIAIHLGGGEANQQGARLASFDAVWTALSPDEQRRATAFHLSRDASPARITVAFAEHN
jgi:cell division protein FtsQ